MIRISCGPIRISTRTDDRWAQPIRYWQTNGWAYVEESYFDKLRHFESPLPLYQGLSTEEQIADATALTRAKMKDLGAYNAVHEFNAVKGGNYYRMCAILNNDSPTRLQPVSWFDAWVKYPIYEAICWVANKVLKEKYL